MGTARPKLFIVPRKRPVAQMLTDWLERMSSVFERIVYTGGCRGEDGRYTHPELDTTHDPQVVHRVLLSVHERLFRQWLDLPFVEQDADVWRYFAGLDRRKVLRIWPNVQPWHRLAPPGASERERQRWSAVFNAIFDDAITRTKQARRRNGKGSGDDVRNRHEHEVSGRRRDLATAGDRVRAAGAE